MDFSIPASIIICFVIVSSYYILRAVINHISYRKFKNMVLKKKLIEKGVTLYVLNDSDERDSVFQMKKELRNYVKNSTEIFQFILSYKGGKYFNSRMSNDIADSICNKRNVIAVSQEQLEKLTLDKNKKYAFVISSDSDEKLSRCKKNLKTIENEYESYLSNLNNKENADYETISEFDKNKEILTNTVNELEEISVNNAIEYFKTDEVMHERDSELTLNTFNKMKKLAM